MALRAKNKSLAEKINSLVTTTPVTFNSDDEAEDTRAKVVDYYEESSSDDSNLKISAIRRQNVDPLDQMDERYKGKKVSRKDIHNNNEYSDLQSESEEEDMDNSKEKSDHDIDTENSNTSDIDNSLGEDESNNDVSYDDDSDNSGVKMSNDSNSNSEQSSEDEEKSITENKSNNDIPVMKDKSDFQTIAQTNVRADIEKGNCIRSQLSLWESLLEIRIKLQKCLASSNQMPQHDTYKNFKIDMEYTKTVGETKDKLKILLNNMLQLQSLLLRQYPETRSLSNNNRKRKAGENIDEEKGFDDPMDEEIPSDTEDENESKDTNLQEDVRISNENMFRKKLKLGNYEKMLNENHKLYVEYRNTVIQKWNEKTKVASGKLSKGASESTLKQIEFALSDKDKLHKKSRLKRSEYKILGKVEATDDNDGRRVQEYDSEIYDDDDFYHQLLRDLIEYKSSDITDPIQLSKQWIQLQNMRRKMKRKIDTRATKGRRIRYDVHNKLINFMAPITVNDIWLDHAKDELYNSLFGKIKPANTDVGR